MIEDTLRRAVERLEVLRKESAGGGQYAWAVHEPRRGFGWRSHEKEIRAVDFPEGFYDGIADVVDAGDADLIVTLHRTIDAQLLVLRAGLERLASWFDPNSELGYEPKWDGDGSNVVVSELALAKAILGES